MNSVNSTHPGLVRQNNEDCLYIDDGMGLYLLADGMGGHNAGEVASALAVDSVFATISSNIGNTTVDGFFELLVDAMQAAHSEINQKARTSLSYMGMGTTLVVAIIHDITAYIAHAGDSRAYHYTSPSDPQPSGVGLLRRITNDHTMGDQLLANGVPREQIQEKQFHTLTQSIGCGETPVPDCNTIKLGPLDMLLLCSDGLTDMLSDSEIEAVLANTSTSFESLPGELIDAANEKGGHDNISVILIRCDK